jgi:surface protein
LLLFLRFSQCSFFWIVSTITRHRHPPAAFEGAYEFNADISKWNTANVNTMYESTSTPLVSVVLSLEFHSLPLLYFSRFYFWIVSRHRHPPTAFKNIQSRPGAFNADISEWNTAKVTTMWSSTSTPPLCSVVLASFT